LPYTVLQRGNTLADLEKAYRQAQADRRAAVVLLAE
jgi:hypothetical protein